MKILIAADMEGITGVTNWDQVNSSHAEYARFRRLMTGDVNAAVDGAFTAGADEVLVTDGHGYGNNILREELDWRAHLNSGLGSPLSIVQGVDSGVDGVIFVGYHASAGSWHAILDHTYSSSSIANVWLNDVRVGEVGLNAALCAQFDVPVLMVTGDQTVCGEARELLGPVEVAVVKHAVARMSAECLPPQVTADLICEAAARAVTQLKNGQPPPLFKQNSPVQLQVEFFNSEMGDKASLLPGTQREGGRMLFYAGPDMLTVYRTFRAMVALARS